MALLKVSFVSETLHRAVPLVVILPTDKIYKANQPKRPVDKPYKTLYLLHGVLGNEEDWLTGTRIQRWAEANDLAVVMPAGENSFYVDNAFTGRAYSRFIAQELVEFTRKSFPLSPKKEDTFIGGLSMGGYGALYNGLKYHDTFGAIVALSAALMVDESLAGLPEQAEWFGATKVFWQGVFGPDLKAAGQSECNLKVLINNLLAQQVALPAIYLAIGDDDKLLAANVDFHEFLDQKQVAHVFKVAPGSHEWDFWDRHLKRALDWLPLEQASAGINSGNVN